MNISHSWQRTHAKLQQWCWNNYFPLQHNTLIKIRLQPKIQFTPISPLHSWFIQQNIENYTLDTTYDSTCIGVYCREILPSLTTFLPKKKRQESISHPFPHPYKLRCVVFLDKIYIWMIFWRLVKLWDELLTLVLYWIWNIASIMSIF